MQKLEKALSGWEGGLGRTGREVLQIVAPFIKSCILIWQIYRKLFFNDVTYDFWTCAGVPALTGRGQAVVGKLARRLS